MRQRLATRAHELGFDTLRITTPDAIPDAAAGLAAFIATGAHGDMTWLASDAARRSDPRTLWDGVRSIVMLGVNYGPDGDPLTGLAVRHAGNISVYARHRDYHDVIKGKLKDLAGYLAAQSGGCQVKVFVDTAPVMEKPLAAAAGLGWQGKHTNLVSREFGSWLFLGAIFTDADIAADTPESDHCGTCRACLDICPTQAFVAPYHLDARRCISYLTIEHKGSIGREFRVAMGNRIYGCDDCLAVCPWNKYAQRTREAKLRTREDLAAPGLARLARLDDRAFRALFSGSPVKRIGRDRFVRNVMIAVGNSDDAQLCDVVRERLNDGSALVRAMAVWAAARLLPTDEFAALRQARAAGEVDADVRCEWMDAEMAR